MITRRRFLGMFAVLPALTALAGAGIRLPRKDEIEVKLNSYLTSKDAWYLKTENPEGLKTFYREPLSNTMALPGDLSEKVLEDILVQLKGLPVAIRPTHIIVRG